MFLWIRVSNKLSSFRRWPVKSQQNQHISLPFGAWFFTVELTVPWQRWILASSLVPTLFCFVSDTVCPCVYSHIRSTTYNRCKCQSVCSQRDRSFQALWQRDALDDMTPWMPGAVHIRPQRWPSEGNAETFTLGKYA